MRQVLNHSLLRGEGRKIVGPITRGSASLRSLHPGLMETTLRVYAQIKLFVLVDIQEFLFSGRSSPPDAFL